MLFEIPSGVWIKSIAHRPKVWKRSGIDSKDQRLAYSRRLVFRLLRHQTGKLAVTASAWQSARPCDRHQGFCRRHQKGTTAVDSVQSIQEIRTIFSVTFANGRSEAVVGCQQSTRNPGPHALALLLTAALCAPVRADFIDNLYLSAGAGWDYTDDLKLDSNGAEMNFDQGVFQPTVAVGMRFMDDWRIEFERSEHENSPEILYSSSAAVESDSDEGDSIRATNLILNVVRDLDVGLALHPYIGLGIGQSDVSLRFSTPGIEEGSVIIPRQDIVHDSDSSLAWQFIAGFTVPISRRFDVAVDYRYLQAPSVRLQEVSGADLKESYSVQSLWMHLRFHTADGGRTSSPAPRVEPIQGWYVAGNIGGAFAEDAEITGTESVVDAFDIGPATNVAVGYSWRDRLRLEIEAGYRNNVIEVFETSGAIGEELARGDLSMSTLMMNTIFQFYPGSSLRPYVGIGGGLTRADYKIDTRTFCKRFVCGAIEERARILDDSDTTFAAQAIIGVDIAVTPRLHFTADYRYLLTGNFEMQAPDDSALEINTQRSNSVTAGLRYSLGSSE